MKAIELKLCRKCNQEKPCSCFYHNKRNKDGFQHYCKACQNVFSQKFKEKNREKIREKDREYHKRRALEYQKYERERRSQNPEKANAWDKLNYAVQYHLIYKPSSCEFCGNGSSRIEGHHPDYSKPLEVDWLCPCCHKATEQYISKHNIRELQTKLEKQPDLEAENERLKEALELAYEAYKDKCTGKTYTVKQIARVHRFCKQALKDRK